MLLDLCRKNEGNPFSTKIWVVGSYTDTLLKSKTKKWVNSFIFVRMINDSKLIVDSSVGCRILEKGIRNMDQGAGEILPQKIFEI